MSRYMGFEQEFLTVVDELFPEMLDELRTEVLPKWIHGNAEPAIEKWANKYNLHYYWVMKYARDTLNQWAKWKRSRHPRSKVWIKEVGWYFREDALTGRIFYDEFGDPWDGPPQRATILYFGVNELIRKLEKELKKAEKMRNDLSMDFPHKWKRKSLEWLALHIVGRERIIDLHHREKKRDPHYSDCCQDGINCCRLYRNIKQRTVRASRNLGIEQKMK